MVNKKSDVKYKSQILQCHLEERKKLYEKHAILEAFAVNDTKACFRVKGRID